VSVSTKTRCPFWKEMCFVKDLFWDAEEPVMQLHPAKSTWVNNHNYCLHLWRPTGEELPLPPEIAVDRLVAVQMARDEDGQPAPDILCRLALRAPCRPRTCPWSRARSSAAGAVRDSKVTSLARAVASARARDLNLLLNLLLKFFRRSRVPEMAKAGNLHSSIATVAVPASSRPAPLPRTK
jgi:hypothetical protein